MDKGKVEKEIGTKVVALAEAIILIKRKQSQNNGLLLEIAATTKDKDKATRISTLIRDSTVLALKPTSIGARQGLLMQLVLEAIPNNGTSAMRGRG
jgi:hypothetical protein